MIVFRDFYIQFKETFVKSKDSIVKKVAKASAYFVWVIIVIAIIFILIFMFQLLCPKVMNLYSHLYTISDSEPNATSFSMEDEKYIKYLIERNKIVPMSAVYSNTLDYYNSLISILVALLGLFAFVSWFSLRSKIRDDVKDTFVSDFFKQNLDNKIKEIVNKNLPDYVSEVINENEIKDMISKEYELKADSIKEDILNSLEKEIQSNLEQGGDNGGG
jgi:hypothetical protein